MEQNPTQARRHALKVLAAKLAHSHVLGSVWCKLTWRIAHSLGPFTAAATCHVQVRLFGHPQYPKKMIVPPTIIFDDVQGNAGPPSTAGSKGGGGAQAVEAPPMKWPLTKMLVSAVPQVKRAMQEANDCWQCGNRHLFKECLEKGDDPRALGEMIAHVSWEWPQYSQQIIVDVLLQGLARAASDAIHRFFPVSLCLARSSHCCSLHPSTFFPLCSLMPPLFVT